MRHIALQALLILCLSVTALGQYREPPGRAKEWPKKEGELIQRVTADLDGDGVKEHIVLLRGVATRSGGTHTANLIVRDQNGKVLWQAKGSPDGKLAVSGGNIDMAFNGSATLIEVAADIDDDGALECVVSPHTTYGRPIHWQILRWDRKEGFALAQIGRLLESPVGSGHFKREGPADVWIHRFYESPRPGVCHVQICKFQRGDGEAQYGEALVEAHSLSEFKVTKWLVPLRKAGR